MNTRYALVAAGIVLVIALVWWLWPEPAPAPTPSVTEPAPAVPSPAPPAVPAAPPVEPIDRTEPPIVLPPLDDSDPFVREQLDELPLPETWSNHEELVRRLAVVIDNGAKGEYPRRQLGFLAPSGKFTVRTEAGRTYMDPAGYARYDGYLDKLEGIEPAALKSTLELLEPLVQQALTELGNTTDPDIQIDQAIAEIEAVPVVREPIELVRPKVLYEYADPSLEELSPLQKQVLRMGPDNVTRLQTWLKRLKNA